MKRMLIILCLLALLVVPAFALEPLTEMEMLSASYDPSTGFYLYNGYYYDTSGYPVDILNNQTDNTEIETNPLIPIDETSEDMLSDSDVPTDSDPTLIHEENTTGSTQVNVFAIQTEDETGGTWISGGSGDSLVEQLFGPYTPYNASGLASVDWAWIADVTLFAILVICFFKIVAGVIKRV